jgi:rubrerythrin
MDINKFLTLAVQIETQISSVYEKVAKLAEDALVSTQLHKIAGDELNHAATLKMGLNYLHQAPELFVSVNMNEEALNKGLLDIASIQAQLDQKLLLLPALKWLLDLEKRFEKVHIGVSVSLADAHLIQLFKALAKGDQNHIATLTKLINFS